MEWIVIGILVAMVISAIQSVGDRLAPQQQPAEPQPVVDVPAPVLEAAPWVVRAHFHGDVHHTHLVPMHNLRHYHDGDSVVRPVFATPNGLRVLNDYGQELEVIDNEEVPR